MYRTNSVKNTPKYNGSSNQYTHFKKHIEEDYNRWLMIPFEKKDEVKTQFKLKWDKDFKMWYTEDESVFGELHEYHVAYYTVPFAYKDSVKAVGFKWDSCEKEWYGCDYMLDKLPERVKSHITSEFGHYCECNKTYPDSDEDDIDETVTKHI